MERRGKTAEPPTVTWHLARLTAQGKEMHKVTLISPDMFCWLLVDLMRAHLEAHNVTTEVTKWTTPDITTADDDDEIPF
jgi:hypothetical protein